jgi:DUF4097 and DUF4098 domain-containing protein YvlB
MAFERSFPSAGVTVLDVEVRRGDVVVDVSPDDRIIVRADFSQGASEGDLRIEQREGTLRVDQPPIGAAVGGNWFDFLSDFDFERLVGQLGFGRVDLRIAVPASVARVNLKTGLGDARVAQWSEGVTITTGKGDVTLGQGRGPAEVKCGMGAVRVAAFARSCGIQTGMGEVTIGGGQGEARIHTGMGKVVVTDADLRLEANTGMGEVRLERVRGRANVRTGLGALNVADAGTLALEAQTGKGDLHLAGSFQSIRAKSGSGAIFCQVTAVGGPFELNTGHGDVDFGIALNGVGQAIRIDAATGRGRIESDVPLVQVGQPGPESYFGRRLVGTIGDGEVQTTVRVRSGIGNVRLRRLGAAPQIAASPRAEAPPPAPAPEPTVPPSNPAETPAAAPKRTRLDILEALSRGEITVEEAERQLQAL